MKITTSYAVEIKHIQKLFRQTIKIYNEAISFCIYCLENHWCEIKELSGKQKNNYAEHLLHTTKNNSAIYEFDSKFPHMPSYLRRSAIQMALGKLKSYHSNLENWQKSDMIGKPPRLPRKVHELLTFYQGDMYDKNNDMNDYEVRLKLFVNNSWNWVKVKLKSTDVKYIRKHCQNAKMSVPALSKNHHKYYLRFAFEEEVELNKTSHENQKILAVDLGINTDATCSVMNSDGTILVRKFIDFPSDKDLIEHTLNKIKKLQQKYNSHNTTKLWRYARQHNIELR